MKWYENRCVEISRTVWNNTAQSAQFQGVSRTIPEEKVPDAFFMVIGIRWVHHLSRRLA
jgi:hypothetical protein